MRNLFVVLVLGTALSSNAEDLFRMSLKDSRVGELPRGWIAAKTGEGPGSVWKVVADATAQGGKVIAQTSAEGPNRLFNLCVAEDTSLTDVDLTVAFKAVAGKLDQGGGPVWRFRDAINYYLARMNPLEDNFRVYRVVDGKRAQLDSAEVRVSAGEWHRILTTSNSTSVKPARRRCIRMLLNRRPASRACGYAVSTSALLHGNADPRALHVEHRLQARIRRDRLDEVGGRHTRDHVVGHNQAARPDQR